MERLPGIGGKRWLRNGKKDLLIFNKTENRALKGNLMKIEKELGDRSNRTFRMPGIP